MSRNYIFRKKISASEEWNQNAVFNIDVNLLPNVINIKYLLSSTSANAEVLKPLRS